MKKVFETNIHFRYQRVKRIRKKNRGTFVMSIFKNDTRKVPIFFLSLYFLGPKIEILC